MTTLAEALGDLKDTIGLGDFNMRHLKDDAP